MITNIIQHLLASAGVTNLCGTRIKPGIAGENTTKPYLVLQGIAREPNQTTDGAGLNIQIIQIDAYASSFLAADNLADAVEAAINQFSGDMQGLDVLHAEIVSEQSTFETATRLHRVRKDFRIRARS